IAGTTHLDPAAVQACVRIASDALVRVIQGQTMEFQLQLPAGHADRIEPNLESWEQMARGKTAALFGACLASGAVAAGANPQQVAEAQALGEDIGLLFQVQDDYLDLVGEKGRERRATDLAEGKLSFPVLWAYAHGDAKDTERLAQIVAAPREETTDAMIDEGLALLERCGALEGTGRWLLRFGEEVRRRPLAAVVPGLCEQIL